MFWKRRKTFSYTCNCCGKRMEGAPSFGMAYPPYLPDLPESEFVDRIELNDDTCWIRAKEEGDEDLFATRTILEIHIHSVEKPFTWGLWVTQSKESFLRYVEGVGTDQRGEISFGWLPVTMEPYKRTNFGERYEHLACDVLWQDEGCRPKLLLHDSDHPMFIDQRDGISWDKAVEIAQMQMERLHRPH